MTRKNRSNGSVSYSAPPTSQHSSSPNNRSKAFSGIIATHYAKALQPLKVARNLKSDKTETRTVNQLSHIIGIWANLAEKGKRPRQSALQLACFDPAKDHTGSALAGFPCLQQVSFTYHESRSLEVSAYYPTQYLFDRAYGNYLGLCQLGHLVAHALGVKLTRFTCFVARPEVGDGTKTSHAPLVQVLKKRLAELEAEQVPHPCTP